MSVADMCDPVEEKQIVESMMGIDDVSGEPLDPSLTRKARQEEMRGFGERQVYHHVLRSVAQADPEGKLIGVRWVDVNNGTKEVPKVRSRLVGQEFAHGERRDDVHHQLQLVSCCLRVRVKESESQVTVAYFFWVYIELPAGDPMSEGGALSRKTGQGYVLHERCSC